MRVKHCMKGTGIAICKLLVRVSEAKSTLCKLHTPSFVKYTPHNGSGDHTMHLAVQLAIAKWIEKLY